LLWPLVIITLATSLYVTFRRDRDLVDFVVYRTAAVRLLSGETQYRASDGHYQHKYLPAFAFAIVPFAVVDPEVAKSLWFALCVTLLWVFVRQCLRAWPDRRLTEQRLMWLTLLFCGKFYLKELVFGQTNLLLGVVLMGALIAAQRDRPIVSGALVGLAVFIKPYALVLVPWLAFTQGTASLVACGGALVAGLALPASVYGWRGNIHEIVAWYRTVTDTTAPNLLDPENISLMTMWAKWIGVGRTASILAIGTTVVAFGGAAALWLGRRAVREPNYLEFGALMLLVPLISPQGWDYVLLLATPAFVCLVDRWHATSRPWRIVTAASIGCASFTIFDLLGRWTYTHLMRMSIVSVAALGLLACLGHLRWRAIA
jgi:hypothetical protein